jgi:hypothetical protein
LAYFPLTTRTSAVNVVTIYLIYHDDAKRTIDIHCGRYSAHVIFSFPDVGSSAGENSHRTQPSNRRLHTESYLLVECTFTVMVHVKSRKAALLCALLAAGACAHCGQGGLRADLRRESSQVGLALVGISPSGLAVIPFDATERYFDDSRKQIQAISRTGRAAVWWSRAAPFLEPAKLVVEQTNGQVLLESDPPHFASSLYPAALSETAQRLAFLGTRQGPDARRGLYWTNLSLAEPHLVDYMGTEDGLCDWSPDASALVYQKERQIYLFDVGANSARRLAAGSDPTWSPDGDRIAFRGPHSEASLMTQNGAPLNWPLGNHLPISPIQWSPDGKFVSFSEAIPGRFKIPYFSAFSRLVVARVADGSVMTVREFGVEPVGARSFSWIVQYPQFCKECKRIVTE